jgi:hypothetical protein
MENQGSCNLFLLLMRIVDGVCLTCGHVPFVWTILLLRMNYFNIHLGNPTSMVHGNITG